MHRPQQSRTGPPHFYTASSAALPSDSALSTTFASLTLSASSPSFTPTSNHYPPTTDPYSSNPSPTVIPHFHSQSPHLTPSHLPPTQIHPAYPHPHSYPHHHPQPHPHPHPYPHPHPHAHAHVQSESQSQSHSHFLPVHTPFVTPVTPSSPHDDNACLTDSDITARTLAASGLNVAAPEFVPSFAIPPVSPPPQPDDSTLSPSSTNVYANVTHHFSDLPVSSSSSPSITSLPASSAISESAVSQFEAQFPALCGAPAADTQRALGWSALQREEAIKAHAADTHRQLEDLYCLSTDDTDVDDAALAFATEWLSSEAPITGDIGAVWVSTGRSVGALYEALRAEAAEQARIRNRCFDRATAAFKKGDGATAKKLSALGREANARMKDLHRKAADAIFEVRNPPGVTDVIDLHGLHVAEALERLPAALEKATEGKVRILTGTGHHTKGTGRARLRPAVKKWLQDCGYFFEEVVDANEYVGSFIVEIKR